LLWILGEMVAILDVKANIEAVFNHSYSANGWAAIRAAALIPVGKHSCSPLLEKRLWVAAAIRRVKPMNQPVTSQEVTARLLACQGDLCNAIPGFIPVPEVKSLPATLQGWELPDLIEQITGYRPNDNRLRAWCKKCGLEFSRNASYSASQQHALILNWVRMRLEERQRAKQQAYQNFHPHLAA
jgi:hypothetical protein